MFLPSGRRNNWAELACRLLNQGEKVGASFFLNNQNYAHGGFEPLAGSGRILELHQRTDKGEPIAKPATSWPVIFFA